MLKKLNKALFKPEGDEEEKHILFCGIDLFDQLVDRVSFLSCGFPGPCAIGLLHNSLLACNNYNSKKE